MFLHGTIATFRYTLSADKERWDGGINITYMPQMKIYPGSCSSCFLSKLKYIRKFLKYELQYELNLSPR